MIFLAPAVRAEDPLGIEIVSHVKAKVSAKKPSIDISVKNKRSYSTSVEFIGISVERRGQNGGADNFRVDIECTCNAKCNKTLVKLKNGESLRATWDLLSNDCQKASPGIYRFVVTDRYSEAISGYVYHGASNWFELTE